MNFRQLEYILAVNDLSHFGKAAEQCFVSQATLSEMIRKLEEELGIVIFDRSRSPVILTSQGKDVIKNARDIINKTNELKQLKSSLAGRLSGTIRIGIIPTVAPLLLPLIIKPFVNAYPDINLKIKEATTAQLISDLEANQLDGAILATPVENIDMNELIERLIVRLETLGFNIIGRKEGEVDEN